MKNKETFHFERVVTRNIVTDSFQSIRNIFGLRLRGYEKMIKEAIDELMNEAKYNFIFKDYKLIVNPLSNQSVMIIIYGEGFRK